MYGLSAEDLRIQDRARIFTDELIPFEVEAEMNGGDLAKDVVAGHKARAMELGLYATNMPADLGAFFGQRSAYDVNPGDLPYALEKLHMLYCSLVELSPQSRPPQLSGFGVAQFVRVRNRGCPMSADGWLNRESKAAACGRDAACAK